jgi:hypothetical protein
MLYVYCLPYSTIKCCIVLLLCTYAFMHLAENAVHVSVSDQVQMYSSTTATHVGKKKRIFITVAPLTCTYISKRSQSSVRNLVDMTVVCACISFMLIVWTPRLHSSLISVSVVFVLGECVKRMWGTVNTTLQKKYVQFEWLNIWICILKYTPFA